MTEKQKTIAKEIIFAGTGLHTGNLTTVKLKPSPPNSGIKFVRTDIDNYVIPLSYENIKGILRGTTIGIDKVLVYTVEHLLAVINVFGIDNLTIELNNNEPPVFDGSAKFFVEVFLEAGILQQNAPKDYIYIKEPVVYTYTNGNKFTEIKAYPSNELKIDCTIEYDHPLVNKQQINLVITQESFIKEIASARTYCFDFEIEILKKKGLAKGGNLQNTIIIGIDKIYNNEEKLRYENEFVRHKILDLLGDLYILGKSLKAEIHAYRCGHQHNINFVKKIVEQIGGANVRIKS